MYATMIPMSTANQRPLFVVLRLGGLGRPAPHGDRAEGLRQLVDLRHRLLLRVARAYVALDTDGALAIEAADRLQDGHLPLRHDHRDGDHRAVGATEGG